MSGDAGLANVTQIMVDEHKLILRMIALVESRAGQAHATGVADWRFFLDAVDFIRNYADKFHHGKEEEVLFKELVANGMPRENSPVAAMMMTHDEGRAFVRGVEAAALRVKEGDAAAAAEIVKNARGYAALLRNHIAIEDEVLYPLSERLLPAGRRAEMLAAYAAQEAASPEVYAKYLAMVEKYEKPA